MVLRPLPLLPGAPPLWFDSNAHCEYYEGALGHTVVSCIMLKAKVQELINSKFLSFKEIGPNMVSNPLPPHRGPIINAIEYSWLSVIAYI